MTTPPLVLAHGFTQTAASWGPLLALLGTSRPLRPVDVSGHGAAPVDPDLPAAAIRLGRDGGPGAYVGYSLGGRVALHLALARPDLVHALVLLGAHPGIEDDRERAARRRDDDRLATRLEDIGLAAFLDEWLAQPLFASLPPAMDQRAARLTNDPATLAATLRNLSTGRQVPLWDRLGDLHLPVLVLAGERDEKYTRLGHRTAVAIGPNATFASVADAGHAAHLEQPELVARQIRAFLGDRDV